MRSFWTCRQRWQHSWDKTRTAVTLLCTTPGWILRPCRMPEGTRSGIYQGVILKVMRLRIALRRGHIVLGRHDWIRVNKCFSLCIRVNTCYAYVIKRKGKSIENIRNDQAAEEIRMQKGQRRREPWGLVQSITNKQFPAWRHGKEIPTGTAEKTKKEAGV